MNVQDCLRQLLLNGLQDWIQAAEVAAVARTIGGAKSDIDCRQLSLHLIRKLIARGWAEVGMVREGVGFIGWRLPIDDAIRLIEEAWPTDGPGLGETCWLNLSQEGHELAQRLVSRNHDNDELL